MLVSIVIPAFNEEGVIQSHLAEIARFIQSQQAQFEILVVDDGSKDQTRLRVEEFKASLPEAIRQKFVLMALPHNRGKGCAVKTGMLAAQGDIRGFTDADGSTPIAELARVLPLLASAHDVVIGTRVKRSNETKVRTFLHRRLIGRAFRFFLKILVPIRDHEGRAVQDTQCGFKWFRGKVASDLFQRQTIDGFAFDVELLYLANRLGYSIHELPINWADKGHSSVNLFSDPLKMAFQVFSVAFKHRKLSPQRPDESAA